MNRAAKQSRLFESDADYRAFRDLTTQAIIRFDIALFAYVIMPNHWHFVLSSRVDGHLSRFMHWFEVTHARRWALARGIDGQGAVYQGRFKAIPIQTERYFLWACRYVERNALRANLVDRAEDWRWSSLWQRRNGYPGPRLCPWPVSEPLDWIDHVNTPQTDAEVETFRRAVRLGLPLGDEQWLQTIGEKRRRACGRPKGVLEK